MSVIAKMRCNGIKTSVGNYDGKEVLARYVEMTAVWSDDPKSDSKKFCDATPSGKLELYISNPEAGKQFTPGKEYYVTIEEAPEN